MIMGHALHGHARNAISLFDKMKLEGVGPNYISFVAILTTCNHARLVDNGWVNFYNMVKEYGIPTGLEHYAVMADLPGRIRKLEEAY